MKNISKHTSLMLIGTVMVCAAIVSPANATIPKDNKDECYFVSQLKDPITRMEFVMRLELAKQKPDMLTGIPSSDGEQFLVSMMDDQGRPAEVDQFSYDCMSCHDGLSAASHNARVKASRHGAEGGFSNAVGNHPIGMDYGSCAAGNRSYKDASEITFVAGRVGCLSCHNPLNPERYHLAVDNNGSGLCYTCHNT